MIAALDHIDGDPDLEADPDFEPLHGSREVQNPRRRSEVDQTLWAEGGDSGEREPDADLEPSLGAPGGYYPGDDQRHWSAGGGDDLEEDKSDFEPSEDDEYTLGRSENIDQTQFEVPANELEPSLGASAAVDQRRWGDRDSSAFPFSDLEEQCEDEGGACEDEGWDSDREPDEGGMVLEYFGDDQTKIVTGRVGDRVFTQDLR